MEEEWDQVEEEGMVRVEVRVVVDHMVGVAKEEDVVDAGNSDHWNEDHKWRMYAKGITR